MRWYRAVALDLDGTLTTGDWPQPAVLDRIAALRADGVRMLLITGRILADLDVEFPGLADRFDVVVAWWPRHARSVSPPPRARRCRRA